MDQYTLELRAQLIEEFIDKLRLEAFALHAAARRAAREDQERREARRDLREAQRYYGEDVEQVSA